MKINYTLMVIVLIAAVISFPVTADSEVGVGDSKKGALSVDGNGSTSSDDSSDNSVNGTAYPTKKGNAVNLDNNDSREQLKTKEKESGVKKGNGGDQSDEEKGRLPPVKEKCDSSSNRCTDDDKTLVACLIFPGNESPALALLILNKGKGPQSITISAPDSVQLESKQIELQQNKDIEVKVSVRDVVNGDSIVLTAAHGHGNCTLDLKDEVLGINHSPNSRSFSIYKLSSSRGVVILGGLVIAAVSVLLCRKTGRKYYYLARKGRKYTGVDMELPVSLGSAVEGGGNEGWDNSWGDSWDDEEASVAPSLPLTPTLSSRKFKEGWKD